MTGKVFEEFSFFNQSISNPLIRIIISVKLFQLGYDVVHKSREVLEVHLQSEVQ